VDDPTATAGQLYRGLKESLRGNVLDDVDEVFLSINDLLAREFDVLAYRGGVRTGGTKHNAYVVLDPGKVRVATTPSAVLDPPPTLLNWEDLDLLARERTLRNHNRLLFNLSEKGQTAEALRLVFPFFEAFKEIITSWSKVLIENPQALRRAQTAVQGARESGFFYTDPTSRKDMFGYAGLDRLAELVALRAGNVNLDLKARVEGLNFVTGGAGPGFGPFVGAPVGALLPRTEPWESIRDLVLPFGSRFSRPEDLLDPAIWTEAMLPAWMQKVATAFLGESFDERLVLSTQIDVMRALAARGGYTPEDTAPGGKLQQDAERVGKFLLYVRGFTQAALPTGFQYDFQIEADNPAAREQIIALMGDEPIEFGPDHMNMFTIQTISTLYQKLLTDSGNEYDALVGVMDAFGYETDDWEKLFAVGAAVTGKSQTIKARARTTPGVDWQNANRDLVEALDYTIGYFAPESANPADFDISSIIDAVATGESDPRTAAEMAQAGLRSNFPKWAPWLTAFMWTDKFNRRLAANTAVPYVFDLAKKLDANGNNIWARNAMRELRLDPDKIVDKYRDGTLEGSRDLDRAAFFLSNESQFMSRPENLPFLWQSPMGQLMTQFKHFIYLQSEFYYKYVAKVPDARHRIMRHLALLGGSAVVGEGIADLMALMRGQRRDEFGLDAKGLDRIMYNMSYAGGIGMAVEMLGRFAGGRMSTAEFLMGPSATTIVRQLADTWGAGSKTFTQMLNGEQIDWSQWATPGRTATFNIPVIGNTAGRMLFPPTRSEFAYVSRRPLHGGVD